MIIQAFELLKPFLVLMIKTVWGVISSIWQFGVEFIKFFLSIHMYKEKISLYTGGPLIVRFLGPRKNRTNGNPYY